MKNLLKFSFVLCLSVFLFSCSSDDDNSSKANQLTFDGKTYTLKTAGVDYFGEQEGIHNHDISIITSSTDAAGQNPTDEIFSMIYFETFSDSKDLKKGKYTFSDTEQAGTFSEFSSIVINYNNTNEEAESESMITSGELNIIDANTFEVSFKGIAGGKEFSGYYKGKTFYFDENDEPVAFSPNKLHK
ncbi:MAG: hypothetical protein ACTJGD_00465 [Mesonia hippocampi]|uniref:hypothetical protein n=1 Tax=Mesonia hippocampi TaxID=1628250 RepID=UPI003F9CAD16